ncbi:MAG TPA: DUF1801 domain-containing protein [Gemmatimonadaceae bacterium]|nr:DUF1801 domain-containing protein [Gemmatimonadaceae bacterium]
MPKSSSPDQVKSRQQVRAYIAKLPAAPRKRIKELADTIRKTAPGAVDTISYSIPAFRLNGRILVWYAAWKSHLSMYPLSAEDRTFAAQKGFKTAKGTVQFPLDDPLPVSLIKRLVKSRIAAVKAAKA